MLKAISRLIGWAWCDGAKDVVIILSLALVTYLLIWQASQPNVVAIADARTDSALRQVAALQTQVARYPTPTPKPCRSYYMDSGFTC